MAKSITVIGRRWRDVRGNTYHTAEALLDVVAFFPPAKTEVTYGYGNQYEATAVDMLAECGVITDSQTSRGDITTIPGMTEGYGRDGRARNGNDIRGAAFLAVETAALVCMNRAWLYFEKFGGRLAILGEDDEVPAGYEIATGEPIPMNRTVYGAACWCSVQLRGCPVLYCADVYAAQ